MDFLPRHVEALIFCSTTPLNVEQIQACLNEMFDSEVPKEDIEQAISQLVARYQSDDFSMEIVKAGNGYQFLTKPAYQQSISILLKQSSNKKLSKSSLETLAIVAYKQPVSKSQVEQVRGVNCDYALKKLLERELVEIKGKSDSIGRPMLYGTSPKFLEYFGINDLNELPQPKDFKEDDNEIGQVTSD